MNFHRTRGVGAACLALLTLLTLSSCGGQQADQSAASPSESTSPSTAASPSESTSSSTAASPSESTSPSTAASPATSTSPGVSTTASEAGVKPQGTTCPADAPVKGNLSKRRGKIYHLPSSPNYSRVKPEECFPNAAAAEKAGFHAPRKSKV